MLQENIKAFRKNRGLTQEELAIRVNVVRQTVSKWEKGLSVPDADMLQKIAEVLEVTVSQLLGEEKEVEHRNEIAEQLSRINEQLAIRNRRAKRIWTALGILLGIWILICSVSAALSFTTFNGNRTVTEMTVSEVVEVLENEDGNVLTITKIED